MSRFLSILPQGLFYGNIYRESEIGGYEERDDTLVVDSSYFYLTSNAEGKPLLSFIESSVSSPPGGNDTEIQFNSNGAFAGDSNFVWNAAQRGIRIVPEPSATDYIEYGNADGTSGFSLQSGTAPTIYNNSTNVIEFFDDSILPKFPIQHGDGTAGAPVYTFEADLNTGIFRPGSDKLGLTAGAKEMIRLTNQVVGHDFVSAEDRLGVNLGVGVVPKSTLHVQGDGFFENGKVVAAGFYTPDGGEITGGGAATDHGTLTGLGDDDHTQYTLVDGTRAFSGDQSMGGNRLTNLAAPTSGSDAARLQDIGPAFYGLFIKETGSAGDIVVNDTIEFDANHFYIDSTGKPTISLTPDQVLHRVTLSPGSDTEPAIEFADSVGTSTGIYSPADNQIGFATDSGLRLSITNTAINASQSLRIVNGSTTTPGLRFSDSNTGIYQQVSDSMGLVAGGNEVLRVTQNIAALGGDRINIEDKLGINIGLGTTPGAALHVQGNGLFENGKIEAAGFYLTSGGELLPGSGEANTASSLGGDESIFGQKSGVDLQFKGLTAGSNFSLTSDGNSVTLNAIVPPGFYGVVFRESEFGGHVEVDDTITFDSNFFYLSVDGSSKPILSLHSAPKNITLSKSITVESPTSSEDIIMFFTPIAITVTDVRAVVRGTTPSVNVEINHNTDRSAAGNIAAVDTAITNTTTGQVVPLGADPTIPANSWVWLETSAQSGTVNEVGITTIYTED